jgi:hypothetical protein
VYAQKHLPSQTISFKKPFVEEVMGKFTKWNQMITVKSLIHVQTHMLIDHSVEQFHHFAHRWTFGNSDKSSAALAAICDINGYVAEQLNRPDLKATWQVIKMIYADHDGLQHHRTRSSRHTSSANKLHHLSDPNSGHRHHYHAHHHHHHHPPHRQHHSFGPGKVGQQDQQHQQGIELESSEGSPNHKRSKTQEQLLHGTSRTGMEWIAVPVFSFRFFCAESMDETDTYILRDVLTDDIIFIIPEDMSNSNNGYELTYDNDVSVR